MKELFSDKNEEKAESSQDVVMDETTQEKKEEPSREDEAR